MQPILRRFQKSLGSFVRGALTSRVKDPCIDEIGKYGIQIIRIVVFSADFSAYRGQLKRVVDRLQEQVSPIELSSFPIRDFSVWVKHNRQAVIFFFLLILFRFYSGLFLGPLHHVIPGWAVLLEQFF